MALGTPAPRIEDERFLTGRGRYVADIDAERIAHVAFLASPYAHATIDRIDVRRAAKMPGVLTAVAGKDLGSAVRPIPAIELDDAEEFRAPAQWPMPWDRVRYVGEAVAAVVAESAYAAQDALEAIEVAYGPLPALVDGEAALRADAPRLHDDVPGNLAFRWRLEGGDVDRAFAAADVVLERRIVNSRVQPAPMEPSAVLASWDPKGKRLSAWVTSQNPHDHRDDLAKVLGLARAAVRVVTPDVGGAFGAKIAVYPREVAACHLARIVGRPVRWVESRTENLQAMTHGRDQVQDVRLAATAGGEILGIDVRSVANLGAYLSTAGSVVPTGAFGEMLSGAYRMRAARVEVLGALTNTAPTGPYRGAGRPEATYLVERMVDLLARRLDMDPAEIRRRNFVPADAFPYRTCTGRTYDSGDYARGLERALERVEYSAFRAEQQAGRAAGRLLGIGLSSYVEICGVGPGLRGTSTVRVHADGTAEVLTGAQPHGQGGETMVAQIAADVLGLPLGAVRVVYGDTDAVPTGVGTFGSRSTAVEGSAVRLAAEAVADAARRLAAKRLEARIDDLVLEGGRIRVKGVREPSVGLADIARGTPARRLEATKSFNPKGFTYPYGTHACVVDVDQETGEVSILRYVAVDDFGVVVNPLVAEGQVHGGVIQGIAQALWERAAYDDAGNLLTSTFLEALVPTAIETPGIESERLETPSPNNPLGAKGAGEAGTIAAPPAVVNAVVDALAPYGVDHLDMPLTPEKVWRAIREGPGRKDT